MNSAVTPLIGRCAAAILRMIPGPASKRKTREPTTTAVAGPEASGSGLGIPTPSITTTVLSALADRAVTPIRTGVLRASTLAGAHAIMKQPAMSAAIGIRLNMLTDSRVDRQ